MDRGVSAVDRFTLLAENCRQKPHGTRSRYRACCKCLLCRAANSRYESERARLRKNGDWNGIVDASRARRHIVRLSRSGVGRRSISETCGVRQATIQSIKTGKKIQIRARTERAILSVDRKALGAAALIPADTTWKQINWLLNPDRGFTKTEIARRLGYKSPALQIRKDRITMKTAVRIDRLYRQMHR